MNIVVNQPNRPDGDLIEVPGMGLFENGTSTPVDEERLQVAVDGGVLPPELLEATEDLVLGDPEAELPAAMAEPDEAAVNQPLPVEEAPVEAPPEAPPADPVPPDPAAPGGGN